MGGRRIYEIVLVDNGSTDATVDRAKGKGARTFVRPELTIGGLRNYGVSNTTGDIIVFLDADVYLRDGWGDEFEQTLILLDKSPTSITGSMCSVRSNPSWIEKYWFKPSAVKKKMKYINCAHLIMTKEFFRRIGEYSRYNLF